MAAKNKSSAAKGKIRTGKKVPTGSLHADPDSSVQIAVASALADPRGTEKTMQQATAQPTVSFDSRRRLPQPIGLFRRDPQPDQCLADSTVDVAGPWFGVRLDARAL